MIGATGEVVAARRKHPKRSRRKDGGTPWCKGWHGLSAVSLRGLADSSITQCLKWYDVDGPSTRGLGETRRKQCIARKLCDAVVAGGRERYG